MKNVSRPYNICVTGQLLVDPKKQKNKNKNKSTMIYDVVFSYLSKVITSANGSTRQDRRKIRKVVEVGE